MKKKMLGIILSVFALIVLVGCNNSEDGGKANKNTKGKCAVLECINQLTPENTVDEVNSIIGFDGKLIDEENKAYEWKLSDKTGIRVSYGPSGKGTIEAEIDRDAIANSKVDFSRYKDELKPKVKDGITYSDFITYIGNVEGTMIEKNSNTTIYIWVAKDGGYLRGSFRNDTKQCTFVSGRIQ